MALLTIDSQLATDFFVFDDHYLEYYIINMSCVLRQYSHYRTLVRLSRGCCWRGIFQYPVCLSVPFATDICHWTSRPKSVPFKTLNHSLFLNTSELELHLSLFHFDSYCVLDSPSHSRFRGQFFQYSTLPNFSNNKNLAIGLLFGCM